MIKVTCGGRIFEKQARVLCGGNEWQWYYSSWRILYYGLQTNNNM